MLAYLLTLLEDEDSRVLFRALYAECDEAIRRVAYRDMHDRHDAEDVIQSAYEKIICHFEKILAIPRGKWPIYCISIVENECRAVFRKRKAHPQEEDWDAFVQESKLPGRPSAAPDSGVASIVACIRKMPESYRAALEMKFLLGYTNSEIADMLGLSVGAVEMRITRGRKLLQERLIEEGITP